MEGASPSLLGVAHRTWTDVECLLLVLVPRSLVDLNQKPTYVVQIGPVSPMIRVELAKLEPRQVKTLEQFKKLLGKHLLPILSALHSKMAVRSTPGRQQAFPEVRYPSISVLWTRLCD